MLSGIPSASRITTTLLTLMLTAAFGLQLRAQEALPVHVGDSRITGLPDDWTHHHLVFSGPGTERDAIKNGTHEQWLKTVNDPRYVIHELKRNHTVEGPSSQDVEIRLHEDWKEDGGRRDHDRDRRKHEHPRPSRDGQTIDRDWSMNLGGGGHLVANEFPAKFNFAVSTASCGDYVAFPTAITGNTNQATVVAYNNLYATTCFSGTQTGPSIAWAYNTGGGTASLSPVLSLDGTQVAYVQTVGSVASLVLLKWNANTTGRTLTGFLMNTSPNVTITAGTLTSADLGAQISGGGIPGGDTISAVLSSTTANLTTTPSNQSSETLTIAAETAGAPGVPTLAASAALYRTCTAPCYFAMALNGNPNDTNSAPFYDYVNDVMYVGDDSGLLHKFTGVFFANPAEITGGGASSGWPQTMAAGTKLSSPVNDSSSGNVFVGSSNGILYRIPGGGSATGGGSNNIVASGQLAGHNATGVVDGPLVDSAAQKVYVFVAEDNNNVNCDGGHPCFAAVYQLATAFAASNVGTEQTLGGISDNIALYSGAFDNIYYSSGNAASPSGNLYVCGLSSGGNNPTLYRVPIAGNVLGTPSSLAVTGGSATCSPVTELYNSNSSTDWIFLSVTNQGNQTGCTNACVYNFNVTSGTTPSSATAGLAAANGTSGISIDNSSSTTGASQVYYTTLGNQNCAGNGTFTGNSGNGSGGCAVQASQSGLF